MSLPKIKIKCPNQDCFGSSVEIDGFKIPCLQEVTINLKRDCFAEVILKVAGEIDIDEIMAIPYIVIEKDDAPPE